MMPVDDAVGELVRGLRHANPTVRIKSARGLAKRLTPAREAFSAILGAVDDPEQGVREAAVQALSVFGQDALPTLIELLHHPDKYVRRNAVWAIGKFGPAARFALPALCDALKDADSRAASGAAQALGNMGEIGGPAVPALIDAMRGTNVVLCRLASKALSQIGPPALDSLVANLRHHDPFVRAEAALAIGWMGDAGRDAVSELVQLIEAYRLKVRPRPMIAPMGNSSASITPPTPAQTGPLSSEETARLYAIQALGRIGRGAATALGLLNEIATREDEPYRAAADLAARQLEWNERVG